MAMSGTRHANCFKLQRGEKKALLRQPPPLIFHT
jgi:hypothetical protein